MTPIKLDDKTYVSGQLQLADFDALAAEGFKSVINNRPNTEEPGQPSADAGQRAAEAAGMQYDWLPVTMESIDEATVELFGNLLRMRAWPILAHCRSGGRCTLLWALAKVRSGEKTVDEAMAVAQEAGFDLSGASAMIETYAAKAA